MEAPPAPRRKSPGTRRTVPLSVRHSLIIYVQRAAGARLQANAWTFRLPIGISGTGTPGTASAAKYLDGMGVRL